MQAIVRSRYGSPDVLELREIEKPQLRDDGLLVRVIASSVNTADVDYLRGRPRFARFSPALYGVRAPANKVLGLNVAGVVEAVGRGVTDFQVGEAVIGDLSMHRFGAFAEFASAPAQAFARKPVGLTFEEAATLPHAGVLAVQGFRGGRPIRAGDRVLVNGASGSVGPFAVQIAASLGAEVTGVCSTAKMDMVRAAGAHHVIDYTKDDFTRTGQRYDRIIDMAGTRSIFALRRALRPKGTYLWVGGSNGRLLQAVIVGPLISVAGGRKMGLLPWVAFRKEDVARLLELVDAGTVKPAIDRTYPLAGVPDALRYLEGGTAMGKVVITIGDITS